MSETLLVVDSGTTSTRVRRLEGERVAWTGRRQAGARDTAIEGSTAKLRRALAELVTEALAAASERPRAVVCSGMITSNMGLLEVPHLIAPAGPDDLARAAVRHDFPDIARLPFVFLPGVKTLPQRGGLEHLPTADVLRGEECESEGLRHLLGLDRPVTLLHVGSHHKAIDVAQDGTLLASRTAITGELLAATVENTILRSSVVPLAQLELDEPAAAAGLAAALEHGFGRALFLVRVGEQIAGRGRAEMTSYLLGALAGLDLPLVGPVAPGRPVVLYGAGPFPAVLAPALRARGHEVVTVDPDTSDLAAAVGAALLLRRAPPTLLAEPA